jgi:hypothetical protein
VYLTVDEYRLAHRAPGHYIAVAHHIDPRYDQVVERTSHYVVVTTIEVEALNG